MVVSEFWARGRATPTTDRFAEVIEPGQVFQSEYVVRPPQSIREVMWQMEGTITHSFGVWQNVVPEIRPNGCHSVDDGVIFYTV